MMRLLPLALSAITILAAYPASAEQHWMGKGVCKRFFIEGKSRKCGGVSLSSELANGRVMSQFPFQPDNLIMFSGEQTTIDGFPAIIVDNVSLGLDPKKGRRPASGTCIIAVNAAQHVVACDAKDSQGREYSVQFSGAPA